MKRTESHISLFLKSIGFIPRGFANDPSRPGIKIYLYDTPEVNGRRSRVSQGSALSIAKKAQEKLDQKTIKN